jgi:hypothetical protein
MDKEQPEYLSYLLRLWRVNGEGRTVWRASLENPHTGERRGFAHLADLFTYLEKETGHLARGRTASNADEKGGNAHK